jgi:hypothetical protein
VLLRQNGHVRWLRSLAGFKFKFLTDLVRNHSLQFGLVGLIGDNTSMQFVLAFARLGRQNVPGECMLPDNLPRPGFFEPFGRTFMGLKFRHDNISGKLEV